MDNYYNHLNNKLNSQIRSILISLVADLHKKISFLFVGNNGNEEKRIPFYFSLGGGETYLQNYFVNDPSQDISNVNLEGLYDEIPRGIITLNGVGLDTQNLANRWTPLILELEENGQMKRMKTLNRNIPINLNVNCKIMSDNILNTMLITEALLKQVFRRPGTFYDYNGVPIAVTYRFPFDPNIENVVEYDYTTNKNYEITFDLTVTSYIMDIIEDASLFEGNRMENLVVRISDETKKD